jgi:predicted PurR-regulated permease PerM
MSEAEVAQSNESTSQPVAIRLPVAGHGLALTILATVAVIFALEWAQSFVISLLVGILFAYTLNPLVVWLERIR